MSEIGDFKDKVQAISTRYGEMGKTGHKAQVLSRLLEARISSILKIGGPLLEMSEADLSPLPKLLDLCREAKEGTPTRTELSDPEYPVFTGKILAQAQYIEEATQPSPDHDPARAGQLMQSALEKLSSAFVELDQAKTIFIDSGLKMGVAGKLAEHLADELNRHNNSL